MPRRGKCRCGTVLTFERTAQGYKVRCPNCQAVVRLRAEEAAPPPAPAPSAPTDFETPELVEEYDILEALRLRKSSAPAAMVEMEVYQEPTPARRGGLWLLVGLAVVGVALLVGTILVVLNNLS
jgi:hypothetical protein